MISRALPLEDILEADWRKDVVKLAKTLGWISYFTFNSRGSSFGFPDLVLTRERVIFIELKREKTKPTDDQKMWLRRLLEANAEAYVARPHDLDDLALILAGRLNSGRATGWLAAAARLRQATEQEAA